MTLLIAILAVLIGCALIALEIGAWAQSLDRWPDEARA